MKRTLLFMLLFMLATTMNAQILLKGDMNGDGKISFEDVNALADVLVGKAAVEAISVYKIDNSSVVGTWYAVDGTMLIFREDGTTNYPGGNTYEFLPILGRLMVYDAEGVVVKIMTFKNVTPEFILEENTVNGTLTSYTNSAYVVTDITLNRNSLTINSGDSFLLQAVTYPFTALNSGVTWTSSDEDVATVDASGMVSAVSGGTCTITCMAKDGGGASTTCEVKVVQLVTNIMLSQTALTLGIDGYKKLTATVLPSNASNKSLIWTSSDESVVEVTSTGGVAAIGIGSCTITCTAADGSGVIAACEVNVVFKPVSSITLSSPTTYMRIDDTHQLTATVEPSDADNPNVLWTSSDETIATVDQTGLVTAIAGGTCTITASAADGSGVVATCEVNVVLQPVTDITLSSSTIMLNIDETHQLTAAVTPADADNPNLTWTSSDETIASVDQTGQVTAIDEGTCTITASATDGSGVFANCTVNVSLHEYVDLGLPSGTLWATCNIGADNPEDFGDYFAWGETEPKENYSWTTYKYCNGSSSTLTKYCNNSSYGYNGFTDNLLELEPTDDAAYVNWGSAWCMPDKAQFDELCTECSCTWVTINGVSGFEIKGSNGNSIFLPTTTSTSSERDSRRYWSRTLYDARNAYYLEINTHEWKSTSSYGGFYDWGYGESNGYYYFSPHFNRDKENRYYGRNIRPVRLSQN